MWVTIFSSQGCWNCLCFEGLFESQGWETRQRSEERGERRERRGSWGEKKRETYSMCCFTLQMAAVSRTGPEWSQRPGALLPYPVGGWTQVMGHCFPSKELDWKRGTRTWISNHIRFWHRRWKLFQLYQNAGFCNCFSTGLIVSTIVPYTTNTIRTFFKDISQTWWCRYSVQKF